MEPYKVMQVRVWQENSLGENLLHYSAEPAVMTNEGCYAPGCLHTRVAGLPDDLDGLSVKASRRSDGAEFYACRPEFHDMSYIDLAKAERMVKALRRVNRHLDKLIEQLGCPTGAAQWTAYAAAALGIKGDRPFVRYVKEMRIDGTHWAHMSADSLADWLREQEAAYLERRPAAKWAA